MALSQQAAVQHLHSPEWYMEGDTIYFELPPTRGTYGDELLEMLAANYVWSPESTEGRRAQAILFVAERACPHTVYTVAVLKGSQLDKEIRTIGDLRSEAIGNRKMLTPSIEAACLIRIALSNRAIEEMGVRQIIMMHEPECFNGLSLLLRAKLHGGKARVMDTVTAKQNTELPPESGFAFIAKEVPE